MVRSYGADIKMGLWRDHTDFCDRLVLILRPPRHQLACDAWRVQYVRTGLGIAALCLTRLAAADFNLKLDHQNRTMSERLVELGYNLIIDTCPVLPKALSRANPAMMGASASKVKDFEEAAQFKLFGALQKYRNAVGTVRLRD
jgi:hypothetical protein